MAPCGTAGRKSIRHLRQLRDEKGVAPKKLWITWAVSYAALIACMALTAADVLRPIALILGTAGAWGVLFSSLFLIGKADLHFGKTFLLEMLSVLTPLGLIIVPLLRKKINRNEKIVTALMSCVKEPAQRAVTSAEPAQRTVTSAESVQRTVTSAEPVQRTVTSVEPVKRNVVPAALPPSAVPCEWVADASEVLTAIQKTWGITVKPFRISESDARELERQYPMSRALSAEQAQYAVEKSPNSIFWHEYGAWNDFKYAKFLYKGRLYTSTFPPP